MNQTNLSRSKQRNSTTTARRMLLPVLLLGASCAAAKAQNDIRPEAKSETFKKEVEQRKVTEDLRTNGSAKAESLNRPASLNRPEFLNRPEMRNRINDAVKPLEKAGVKLKEGPLEQAPNVGTTKPTESSFQSRGRVPGKTK